MTGQGLPDRAYRGPQTMDAMKELLRTNNLVRLSWLQALLNDSGIDSLVLDQHASLIEGSIGAIPRRLAVSDRDFVRARALLAEAGEGGG